MPTLEWAAHLVDRLSDAEGLPRSIELAGVTADGLVLGRAPGPQGIQIKPPLDLVTGNGLQGMKLNPETVISRRHCQLLLHGVPPVLAVQDLKSGNRTRVNQKKLIPNEPTPLSEGDTITLGLSAWGANYVFRQQQPTICEFDSDADTQVGSDATEIPSEPAAVRTADWACCECTLINNGDTKQCSACGASAPAKPEPAEVVDQQQNQPHAILAEHTMFGDMFSRSGPLGQDLTFRIFSLAGSVGREPLKLVNRWMKDVASLPAVWPLQPSEIRMGSDVVPAFGLGTLPLGVTYSGGGRPSRPDALTLIHCAIDCGVRFLDTSDMYCEGPGKQPG